MRPGRAGLGEQAADSAVNSTTAEKTGAHTFRGRHHGKAAPPLLADRVNPGSDTFATLSRRLCAQRENAGPLGGCSVDSRQDELALGLRPLCSRGDSSSSLISSQNPTCYLNTSSEQTGLINEAFQNQTKQRGERKKNQKPEWRVWGSVPSGRARALRVRAGAPSLHQCFQFVIRRLYDQLLRDNTTMIQCGRPRARPGRAAATKPGAGLPRGGYPSGRRQTGGMSSRRGAGRSLALVRVLGVDDLDVREGEEPLAPVHLALPLAVDVHPRDLHDVAHLPGEGDRVSVSSENHSHRWRH